MEREKIGALWEVKAGRPQSPGLHSKVQDSCGSVDTLSQNKEGKASIGAYPYTFLI